MAMPPRRCTKCGSNELQEVTLVTPEGFYPYYECIKCGKLIKFNPDE